MVMTTTQSPRQRHRLDVHYQSASDLWETPQDVFDRLHQEFHFDLDACALASNAKCPQFYTPEDDGLSQPWEGVVFMNPPYGRQIGKWIQKAYSSSLMGATVCCLLPARVDTAAWHFYIFPHAEVRFLRGRLKFSNAKNSAPFPSAIVIFRPPIADAAEAPDRASII